MSDTDPVAFIVGLNGEHGGMSLPIFGPAFSIGRDLGNNLRLSHDRTISQRHCVIHVIDSELFIEDTSRNGTLLNGTRISGTAALPVPSSIQMGNTRISIAADEPQFPQARTPMDTPPAFAAVGGR